ncbi:MAG: zinc-binding dehydrogenase [Candidatus Latescibacterota bacterium]|nr:MAG: zinc-binding dehydrogenase [Candidatus Latescibacterota bacterium]
MKAVYYEEHGGPEVLQLGELPDPVAGPGGVLIDVKASSLNHLDLWVRRGLPGIKLPLPHIPGADAAGIVAAIGDGVTEVAVGDRVLVNPTLSCGRCEFCLQGDASLCRSFKIIGEQTQGTCCEKIVVPEQNAVTIPKDLPFVEAASIPLVFLTAWRMMITRGRLRPAETVLILGAAAGVGIACIQIAKVAGARVLAAAGSDDKLALCRELGADVLINYTREDLPKRVREETAKRGVDMCVDYIGKDTWVQSLICTAKGGRVVTCGATTGYDPKTDLRHIFFRQLEIIGSTMGSKNDLITPLGLILDGKMRPVVGEVFPLEQTADAHRLMESRTLSGKIVIRVADSE